MCSKAAARSARWNPNGSSTAPSGQAVSQVAIRRALERRPVSEFRLDDGGRQEGVIQSYVFPLVSWIWIGFWVLLVGTLVCLVPSKQKLQYARTEVVGVAGTYAPVQK